MTIAEPPGHSGLSGLSLAARRRDPPLPAVRPCRTRRAPRAGQPTRVSPPTPSRPPISYSADRQPAASSLEVPFRALGGNAIGLPDGQGYDRKRGIFTSTGSELAAVGDEKILHVVSLAPLVTNPVAGAFAHAA